MKIKCSKCKHEWDTKSKYVFVSCPSCMQKVRVKKQQQEVKEESYKDMF